MSAINKLNDDKRSSFLFDFWDGECVRYVEGDPIAKIIIHEVIPVKDIMAHASLTFGEAYMDGIIEIQGDLQQLITAVYQLRRAF